jgi:hypothetical protein
MSELGRVKYLDPEDVGLMRIRQQRAHAHAHRHPGGPERHPPAAPPAVPPEDEGGYVYDQALRDETYELELPRAAPRRARLSEAQVGADVAIDHSEVACGRAGQSCTDTDPEGRAGGFARRGEGPVATEPDLLDMDLVEFAAWAALVYLPARFATWINRRHFARNSREGATS